MLVHIILYAIALLIVIVGFVAVHIAVFSDRSRGRPRCPRCWYDMTGSTGFVCPECGHDASTQAALQRTRRYHMKALLGALLIVSGSVLVAVPTVQDQGWTALIPTTALMVVMPWTDDEWVFEEVDARVNASNPEWFARRQSKREVSEYGRFFARRCAAVLDGPRSDALRLRAVQLLSDMRLRDDRSERALLDAALDESPTIRNEALNALTQLAAAGSIVDPGRCATRAAECLVDTRVSVRTRAARIFDFLRPAQPDALPALIDALSDERGEVRAQVCNVLRSFGHLATPAIPELIRLIDDPAPRISSSAMVVLGGLGVAATPSLDKLINALEFRDRRTDAALYALARIGPEATKAVPRLQLMLHDRSFSPDRRGNAVEVLFAIDRYDPAVLDAIESSTDIDVEPARLTIATEIGRYRANEPQQVRILFVLLGDPSTRVRQQAALSMGKLAPLRPEEIARLGALAVDPTFPGWEEAQSALSRALEDSTSEIPDFPEPLEEAHK